MYDAGIIRRAGLLIAIAREMKRSPKSWEISRVVFERALEDREADTHAGMIDPRVQTFFGLPYALLDEDCDIQLVLDSGDKIGRYDYSRGVEINLGLTDLRDLTLVEK